MQTIDVNVRYHFFKKLETNHREVIHYQREEVYAQDNYTNVNILPFVNISINRNYSNSHCAYWLKFADVNKITGKREKWTRVVTGLFTTNTKDAFYGDISNINYQGFRQKQTLLLFFFTDNYDFMAIVEYENYYPRVGRYHETQVDELVKQAKDNLGRFAFFQKRKPQKPQQTELDLKD